MIKKENNLRLTCRGCGTQTPLKELSYTANKKDLFCATCIKTKAPLPKVNQKAPKRKTSNKMPYTCKRCNYKFNVKNNSPHSLRCPYCGRDDYLQKNNEFTTSRILREVRERYG